MENNISILHRTWDWIDRPVIYRIETSISL